jgi:hypothetical protein
VIHGQCTYQEEQLVATANDFQAKELVSTAKQLLQIETLT